MMGCLYLSVGATLLTDHDECKHPAMGVILCQTGCIREASPMVVCNEHINLLIVCDTAIAADKLQQACLRLSSYCRQHCQSAATLLVAHSPVVLMCTRPPPPLLIFSDSPSQQAGSAPSSSSASRSSSGGLFRCFKASPVDDEPSDIQPPQPSQPSPQPRMSMDIRRNLAGGLARISGALGGGHTRRAAGPPVRPWLGLQWFADVDCYVAYPMHKDQLAQYRTEAILQRPKTPPKRMADYTVHGGQVRARLGVLAGT